MIRTRRVGEFPIIWTQKDLKKKEKEVIPACCRYPPTSALNSYWKEETYKGYQFFLSRDFEKIYEGKFECKDTSSD